MYTPVYLRLRAKQTGANQRERAARKRLRAAQSRWGEHEPKIRRLLKRDQRCLKCCQQRSLAGTMRAAQRRAYVEGGGRDEVLA
eukprot:2104062-Alexandrium_andersonii.AAC.1